jgi:hypothetical protein
VLVLGRRHDRHDDGGRDNKQRLGGEGGAEHPAALGREVAMEAREEEGPDAEGEQRDARLVEACRDRGVEDGGDAEADVDGVS